MKKLKAVLIVLVSIVLSLSLMSFELPYTDATGGSNVIMYVMGGACVVLIFLCVFFTLQGIYQSNKDNSSSSFSSKINDP